MSHGIFLIRCHTQCSITTALVSITQCTILTIPLLYNFYFFDKRFFSKRKYFLKSHEKFMKSLNVRSRMSFQDCGNGCEKIGVNCFSTIRRSWTDDWISMTPGGSIGENVSVSWTSKYPPFVNPSGSRSGRSTITNYFFTPIRIHAVPAFRGPTTLQRDCSILVRIELRKSHVSRNKNL